MTVTVVLSKDHLGNDVEGRYELVANGELLTNDAFLTREQIESLKAQLF